MKKIIFAIVLFCFYAGIAYAGVDIDVSNSTVEIINSKTIRIHHLTAPCCPGDYWIEFTWDADSLVFIPTAVGTEDVKNNAWTVRVHYKRLATDELILRVDITANSKDRTFSLVFTPEQGSQFIPYEPCFRQGDKFFCTSTFLSDLDKETALVTPDFDNDDLTPVGIKRYATVDHLPAWFDFNSPFTFISENNYFDLN